MSRYEKIGALLNQDRPGYTLPQQLYVGQEAFEFDTQVLLKSVWLYACTVAHVKQPGDFHLFEMGNNSIIIVRGRDGEVRAFHNSCRHRGARICATQSGSAARLMCPYHMWTYGLDGRLLAARDMPEGFDKGEFGLIPVAVENIGGLIFLCLSDNPPPIDRVKADIAGQIAIYDLEHCKVAVQEELVEDANWKLVMENNRECYHCDGNHPELLACLGSEGFGKGLPEDGATETARIDAERAEWKRLGIYHDLIEFPEGWWHRVARLPLANGAVSQTMDGKVASRKLLGPFTEPNTSSLSVWTQPNSWHHFCCDHIVTFSLTPLAPAKTLLRTSWLVHEDAVEGVDYDPANLTAVWRATNRQDSDLCAINHQGIAGDGYRQGPYSIEEKLVDYFKRFYTGNARKALDSEPA
ncbi:aromatic ring-hydroxylating dioxygenase subunit alpha [Sphingomonas oligophenolica]|uniref:Aromatic ring-hydroxylating dioxygenase subunit alpha n=1 Tax=Sphingomonas oligophenolica TaxID=301154 RepID=A0ABU9YC53_9SPHN